MDWRRGVGEQSELAFVLLFTKCDDIFGTSIY